MKRLSVLLACLFLSSCLSTPPPAPPESSAASSSGLPACGSLPDEAWDTVDLIEVGGPFPHPDNDDRRFGNYERILPEQPRDYYREYTVDTPGVHHRGARRIVTGGGSDGHVDGWFYTADHYESFCEMEVN
ncbi:MULTISPECIES: ribonuclease domain-containing protein [Corynebacterium]|uniref:Guanyl-specific ribonuclease St n=1 Tax=Corynebacterium ihumii TaxID=1232427 RepID=A0ABY7UED1_9CORY|nr:ribonuclease domain-containing protein [Corynebacterium ihumii]WCZ35031.1 Guanyl-specific ribonuclease St [Corynebacterium ihumii]